MAWLGLARAGLCLPGLAWTGLGWPGLAWLAFVCCFCGFALLFESIFKKKMFRKKRRQQTYTKKLKSLGSLLCPGGRGTFRKQKPRERPAGNKGLTSSKIGQEGVKNGNSVTFTCRVAQRACAKLQSELQCVKLWAVHFKLAEPCRRGCPSSPAVS